MEWLCCQQWLVFQRAAMAQTIGLAAALTGASGFGFLRCTIGWPFGGACTGVLFGAASGLIGLAIARGGATTGGFLLSACGGSAFTSG